MFAKVKEAGGARTPETLMGKKKSISVGSKLFFIIMIMILLTLNSPGNMINLLKIFLT